MSSKICEQIFLRFSSPADFSISWNAQQLDHLSWSLMCQKLELHLSNFLDLSNKKKSEKFGEKYFGLNFH